MCTKKRVIFHRFIYFTESSLIADENDQYFQVVKSAFENKKIDDTERTEHTFQKSVHDKNRNYYKLRKCKSHDDCVSKDNTVCLQLYHVKGEVWRKKTRKGKLTPEEEKKIQKKINKCLNLVSSQLAEIEDENKLKEDLTKVLVKTITKAYLNTDFSRVTPPVNVFRVEIPKYVIHENIDGLRTKIEEWLKVIPIKRRNSLGMTIEKKEILECLFNKIKPIISNKHQCMESCKLNIKTQILEVLEDLPVVTKRNSKSTSLNRYANMLTEDVLNMNTDSKSECEFDDTNIDIFIRDEIVKFLEKVNLCYSKDIRNSETYLVNILKQSLLLDAYENRNLKKDLSNVLQIVGKFPTHQADYFVNILMRHFDDNFHSNIYNLEHEIQNPFISNTSGSHDYYKCYQTLTSYDDKDNAINHSIDFEMIYRDQLTQSVTDWLVDIDFQIPTKSMFKSENRIVTDLVDDIISISMLFSQSKDEDDEQLLKFQIFEWFNNEFGDHNLGFEEISELIDKISDLSFPEYRNHSLICQLNLGKSKKNNDNAVQDLSLPYDERLADEIYSWLHDLPANMHSSQDASLENQLVKDLAGNIEKGMEEKGNRSKIVDSEVNDWIKKALLVKPKESVTNKLKKRIKNVPYVQKNVPIDYKVERQYVRHYEDLIDDWLNTIPLEARKETDFMKIREDSIHELAKKIYKMRNTGSTDSLDTKKLEEVISDWLKKVPIHPRGDRKAFRDQYAAKLIKTIQMSTMDNTEINQGGFALGEEKLTDIELNTGLLESAALGWLKQSSLYKESNKNKKKKEEEYVKEFAKEYVQAAYAGQNTEAVMMKYMRMLCEGTNTDDNFIQNQCLQLKNHLLSNMTPDLSRSLHLDSDEYINAPNVMRKSPPTGTDIVRSVILNWSTSLPFKDSYSLTDFNSLVDQMAKGITALIVHPELSTDEEQEELMKQKIFEYVQKFPLNPDVKMDLLCDMMAELYLTLRDINLYRDDKNYYDRSQNDSMFRNNIQANPSGAPNVKMTSQQSIMTPGVLNSPIKEINIDGERSRRKSAPVVRDPTSFAQTESRRRLSAPSAITIDKIPIENLGNFQGMSAEQIYEHFDKIFNQYCQEIPLDVSTDENKHIADVARQVFRNGIWKAYFALKSDEEISDNYEYFKFLMEERLKQMLDVILPDSNEMLGFKEMFLSKVVSDVIDMLTITHKVTDPPFLRSLLRDKINRRTARQEYNEYQDMTRHLLIQDIINQHLLFINYKETDSVKANIYRKRLAKVINELINYIRTLNATQPQQINEAAMRLYINETLRNMPAIDNEILKDEVDEILLAQEIEQWFKNLPTTRITNYAQEDEFRRRRCEILAHKIHQIEKKRIDPEDSHCDNEVRQEISLFLGNRKTNLNPDEDLNINFMVEELANRLKNLRDNKITQYESFSKENPASSTLAQIDPKDVIAPNVSVIEKSMIAPVQNQGNNTVRESSNKNMSQIQPGVLGTSQEAGPSSQNPAQKSNFNTQDIPPNVQSPIKNASTSDRRVSFHSNTLSTNEQNQINNEINESLRNNNILSESVRPQYENVPISQSFSQPSPGLQSNVRPRQQSLRPNGQEGPSSQGSSAQEPLASRATASTARVTTNQRNEEEDREDRYRCRCLERLSRCARRFRPFIIYPVPFPCRFFHED